MPLTEEQLNTLLDMQDKLYGSLSEADRATNLEIRQKALADGGKEAMLEELTATFKAADTQDTGRLTFAQFKDFSDKLMNNYVSRGAVKMEIPDDDFQTGYDIHNSVSEEDGVSLEEFLANMAQQMEARKARGGM